MPAEENTLPLRYYDYLSLETLSADETTEAFIVANSDGTYFLRLVPAGTLENLSCDMLNREEFYWRIHLPLTSSDMLTKLFPNGELRRTPLSCDEVVYFFGLDPKNNQRTPFQLSRWRVVSNRRDFTVNRGYAPLPVGLVHDRDVQALPEWVSINTNVLNGDIFLKRNFSSIVNLSRSKYSTFFTPYTSKEDVFSELKNVAKSSLKLFIYLCLSVSVIDFILTSMCFFGTWHDKLCVDSSNLNRNMSSSMNRFSFGVKVALYSTLLDSLFTVANPIVNLLSLVVRSGATFAYAMSNSHEEATFAYAMSNSRS